MRSWGALAAVLLAGSAASAQTAPTRVQAPPLPALADGQAAPGRLLYGLDLYAEPSGERLLVRGSWIVANQTGTPVDPGPEGLRLPLPAGALAATVAEELDGAAVIEPGRGLAIRARIPAGEHEVPVVWEHQPRDGAVALALPVPAGLDRAQVVVAAFPGMELTGPGGLPARSAVDAGRRFLVLDDLAVPPGGVLEVRITGLPRPPFAERAARVLAGLLAIALFGLGIGAVVRRPAGRIAGAADAEVEATAAGSVCRAALVAERDQLFDALVRRERERATSDPARPELRAESVAIKARLAALLRELDALAKVGAADQPGSADESGRADPVVQSSTRGIT